jgi:hypothetical protein
MEHRGPAALRLSAGYVLHLNEFISCSAFSTTVARVNECFDESPRDLAGAGVLPAASQQLNVRRNQLHCSESFQRCAAAVRRQHAIRTSTPGSNFGRTPVVSHKTLLPHSLPPSKERGAQATSLGGATPTKLQGDPHYAHATCYTGAYACHVCRPSRREPRTGVPDTTAGEKIVTVMLF